jgi:hypothetical protein
MLRTFFFFGVFAGGGEEVAGGDNERALERVSVGFCDTEHV